jgi:hypothetical protein
VTIKANILGMIFANSSAEFVYYNYSEIHSMWPKRGPSEGGTLVHVVGKDLDTQSTCLMTTLTNVFYVRPIFINKELILCEVPLNNPETFSFELMWGNGAYMTS